MQKITVTPYGEAEKYTLQGNGGLSVSVITYGATLVDITYKGKPMILSHADLEEYKTADGYWGATVGRYANRIEKGKFTLEGVEYDVGCNEAGRYHLHGGVVGTDKKMWAAKIVDENEPAVEFTNILEDGEEGYPGRLEVKVTMRVCDDNTLSINYEAVSDKTTVFNPTNHAYFSLGEENTKDIVLNIFADAITPVDEMLIPTGELMNVGGTPFDFRTPKKIGQDIADLSHPQMAICGTYDHNFVIFNTRRAMRFAARAVAPSGITLECHTDMPGLQIYAGNPAGFCLETQFYPDSPNKPQFPSCTLKAGEKFQSATHYKFF